MIIFDLDGTLANCEHRRHFVDPSYIECDNPYRFFAEFQITKNGARRGWLNKRTGKKFVPDWKSFYEACSDDEPICPVIHIFNTIKDYKIEIWSGRCESVRDITESWLNLNICKFAEGKIQLKMRKMGDYTPDNELKERWLDEELSKGNKIECVFDDRKKVVEMWVRRGIFVFDVSQGRGDF